MAKSLAASQDIMKNYLSELLTDTAEDLLETKPLKKASITAETKPQQTSPLEKQSEISVENKRLEKLLENVNIDHTPSTQELAREYRQSIKQAELAPVEVKPVEVKPIEAKPIEVKHEVVVKAPATIEQPLQTRKSQGKPVVAKEKAYRKDSFQVMFFDVAGLLIAVPLIELGGIHNVDKTTNLMGKPSWFKGVMLHRDEKINVVDTARWVMPEKCDETLINSLNYQYVIMLSNSRWGLMAENLVDTVTLQPEEVKWLDKPSKRPWLAGLVKKRMCALLDVEALIKLLDDGVGVFAE